MRRLLPFIILLGILAALFRIDFYFTLLYLLIALVVLSRLWLGQGLRRITAHRTFAPRAFLGEKIAVTLTVKNEGWLPLAWLEVNEALPVQLATPPFYHVVLSLNPRTTRELTYTVHCRRRGYYPLGDLTLATGDLLGILPSQRTTIPAQPLLIYPKVVPLDRLGLPTHAAWVAHPAATPLFEDPTRVRGLRPYSRADSPRRIHWSASAHRGELLVKQYQPAIARDTLICLDMDAPSYEKGARFSATETAITVAASLLVHIQDVEKLPVGLLCHAHFPQTASAQRLFLPPRREMSYAMQGLEMLAQVQPINDNSFVDRLRTANLNLAWGTTLVIITGQATESLLSALVTLQRSGYVPALIMVGPGDLPPALLHRTAHHHIPTYRVWDEKDVMTL